MSMRILVPLAVAAATAVACCSAAAQPAGTSNVPNALQGFSQNKGQPVQIEAARLEVRDKDRKATFTGRVKVVQGDTTMRCATLIVFYEPKQQQPQGSGAMPAAQPGPGGSSQISKLEARGGVTVTQKDQTATGETGFFDMKTNKVRLEGNVLVSQGPNVVRGDRLIVDLTTGVSNVESNQGPVKMLIQQGPSEQSGPKPATPSRGRSK